MSITKENLSKEVALKGNVGNVFVDKSPKSTHDQLMNEIVKGQLSCIYVIFIICRQILPIVDVKTK